MVEGDSDRYFYKSVIQQLYPQQEQQIAVLDIGGKGNFGEWTNLFEAFGLNVFRIADFDYIVNLSYPGEKGVRIRNQADVAVFKARHTDTDDKINTVYPKATFILKEGDLEFYLGIPKGLSHVIEFCNIKLKNFLSDDTDAKSLELRQIVKNVIIPR